MALIAALSGLFAAAFVAATLVPFQSEILFVALQLAAAAPLWALVVVASIGNTLGALVNYAIGLGVTRFEGKRWFPVRPVQMARATRWFQRWGVWILAVQLGAGGRCDDSGRRGDAHALVAVRFAGGRGQNQPLHCADADYRANDRLTPSCSRKEPPLRSGPAPACGLGVA